MNNVKITVLLLFIASVVSAQNVSWTSFNGVEKTTEGFITSGEDPFVLSNVFDNPFSEGKEFIEITINSNVAVHAQLFWMLTSKGEAESADRNAFFAVPANQNFKYYIHLNNTGNSKGLDKLRFDPTLSGNTTFTIDVRFLRVSEVPSNEIDKLIKFHVYTSKLHYKPGERIEYKADLFSKYYSPKQSSKIFEVSMFNSKGEVVSLDIQHFGFDEEISYKELYGILDLKKKLKPGKYTLQATITDQMTGKILKAEHKFGVSGKKDPLVYETPFKFVKDFSIIQDDTGLYHIFSITGEFYKGHDWQPKGNERTFSHGTSKDLKTWTYHKPVLSISDKDYADGVEKYENRNIWAPHVIKKGDTYYMFYTSINNNVSQSISLATSKDLYNWTKYENNPIVTMEGVDWAVWERGAWADFRDPMVLEDNGKYYMYVTGTHKEGERGVVVVLESENLINWKNPQPAVQGKHAMESPQVWKGGEKYYMVTSAAGHDVWESNHPVTGWIKSDFARPEIQKLEKYVKTSSSYAEEVIRLKDGTLIMGSLTWRYWGNSIYLFKVIEDETGKPIGFKNIND